MPERLSRGTGCCCMTQISSYWSLSSVFSICWPQLSPSPLCFQASCKDRSEICSMSSPFLLRLWMRWSLSRDSSSARAYRYVLLPPSMSLLLRCLGSTMWESCRRDEADLWFLERPRLCGWASSCSARSCELFVALAQKRP